MCMWMWTWIQEASKYGWPGSRRYFCTKESWTEASEQWETGRWRILTRAVNVWRLIHIKKRWDFDGTLSADRVYPKILKAPNSYLSQYIPKISLTYTYTVRNLIRTTLHHDIMPLPSQIEVGQISSRIGVFMTSSASLSSVSQALFYVFAVTLLVLILVKTSFNFSVSAFDTGHFYLVWQSHFVVLIKFCTVFKGILACYSSPCIDF